jgi:NAD(P)H-hydrate epimerase
MELRELDQKAETLGIPTIVLMENAGRGATELLIQAMFSEDCKIDWSERKPHVLMICGSGNNGGDGAVVARHLDSLGIAEVEVIWTTQPGQLRGLAPDQFQILQNAQISQSVVESQQMLKSRIDWADWLVDGICGTGLTRPVAKESALGQIINQMNVSGKPILSLDIPSGLDADSGRCEGIGVRASLTASFVAEKMGFLQKSSRPYCGKLTVIDIGLPRILLKPFEMDSEK